MMARPAGAPDHVAAAVAVEALRGADEEEFLAAASASKDLHHPWLQPPDGAVGFAALLARAERSDHESYVVRHAACGGLAGFVNLNNIVHGVFLSAYLGYGAFAGHEGRGLMSLGVGAVVEKAFTELGLHRVEANVQPGNHRSLALVRRLGFAREGYSPRYLYIDGDWRDHERWALRVETWAARRAAAHETVEVPPPAG